MSAASIAANPRPSEKRKAARDGADLSEGNETLRRADDTALLAGSQLSAGRKFDVICSTDGACWSSGAGGRGAVVRDGDFVRELSGFDRSTTSNRQELHAVLMALRSIVTPAKVLVRTDSTYARNVCESWCWKWQRNHWLLLRKGPPQPIANRDLIEDLMVELRRHQVEFELVKGHAGDPDNERADQLATAAIRQGGAARRAAA